MKQKDVETYRQKSLHEIVEEATATKNKIADLRFELASGKERKPLEIKRLKAALARLYTIAGEKERTESEQHN